MIKFIPLYTLKSCCVSHEQKPKLAINADIRKISCRMEFIFNRMKLTTVYCIHVLVMYVILYIHCKIPIKVSVSKTVLWDFLNEFYFLLLHLS